MLLEELRTRTRPQHEKIDASLNVMTPDFPREEYTSLLCRWQEALKVLEPAVWEFLDWQGLGVFPAERQRLPLVKEDLRELRADCSNVADYDGFVPRSFPEALGCAYVLEGSTLGGQVIRRHFLKLWGDDAKDTLNFYSGYGEDTGPRWKSFVSALQKWGEVHPHKTDAVVNAAAALFDSLAEFLPAKAASDADDADTDAGIQEETVNEIVDKVSVSNG